MSGASGRRFKEWAGSVGAGIWRTCQRRAARVRRIRYVPRAPGSTKLHVLTCVRRRGSGPQGRGVLDAGGASCPKSALRSGQFPMFTRRRFESGSAIRCLFVHDEIPADERLLFDGSNPTFHRSIGEDYAIRLTDRAFYLPVLRASPFRRRKCWRIPTDSIAKVSVRPWRFSTVTLNDGRRLRFITPPDSDNDEKRYDRQVVEKALQACRAAGLSTSQ